MDHESASALARTVGAMHSLVAGSAFAGAAGVLGIVYLGLIVISIIAAVKVVSKAGYSGWWVLVSVIPVVNFVMILVFAFSDWPVLREVRALRSERASWPGSGPVHGGGAGPSGGSPPDAAAMSGEQAPPGWYPVPDGRLRYWDGTTWTDHFA